MSRFCRFPTNSGKPQQYWMSTDHHLVHNSVAAENVVFPRVLLDVVLHPRGLPRARQADHHNDLHNMNGRRRIKAVKNVSLTIPSMWIWTFTTWLPLGSPRSRPWSVAPWGPGHGHPQGSAAGRCSLGAEESTESPSGQSWTPPRSCDRWCGGKVPGPSGSPCSPGKPRLAPRRSWRRTTPLRRHQSPEQRNQKGKLLAGGCTSSVNYFEM